MNLRDIRHFRAVYETGSFSGAARRLGTVQSNVSQRVGDLERGLRVKLFRRQWRHVEPTPKGRKLYRLTAKIVALEKKMLRALGKKSAR